MPSIRLVVCGQIFNFNFLAEACRSNEYDTLLSYLLNVFATDDS